MVLKLQVTTMTLSVSCLVSLDMSKSTNITLGGAICGSFVVFGVASAILYRPWRKRVDAKRNALVLMRPYEEDEEQLGEAHGQPEIMLEEISAPKVRADRKGDIVV